MSDLELIQCGICKEYLENDVDLFAVVNFYYPICKICYKDKEAIKDYLIWESKIDRLLNNNVGKQKE